MIRATTDLSGYEKFKARYVEAVDKAVGAAAASMQGDIRKSYQTTGPLPGYEKGEPGHSVPSNPGEPPAKQWSNLMKSTLSIPVRTWVYRVVAGIRYAAFLEFGTSRMMARPFMTPGMNSKANQKRALNVFRRVLKRSLFSLAGGGK